MTMTMTEIVGPVTGIDHIVKIDHETTTEMTIEKKIIVRSKTGNIEVNRDYYGDTCCYNYLVNNCPSYTGDDSSHFTGPG